MAKDKKNRKPEEEKAPETTENTQPVTEEAENSQETTADEKDKKIQALEDEIKAEKDKYLRLAAEYDNFRKRNAKEREALYGPGPDGRGGCVLSPHPG